MGRQVIDVVNGYTPKPKTTTERTLGDINDTDFRSVYDTLDNKSKVQFQPNIVQGDNYQRGSTLDDFLYQQRVPQKEPDDDKDPIIPRINQGDSKSNWLSYYEELLNSALDDTIKAYDERIKNIGSKLDEYMRGLGVDEQTAIDESEIERYKGKHSLREALANRGQLDSGYGRMEALRLNNAASKRINDIRNNYAGLRNNAQLAANEDIDNLNAYKVSAKNDFANAYLQAQLANL